MNAAGASYMNTGECKSQGISSGSEWGIEPIYEDDAGGILVGWDADVHGCKWSAGYQWNKLANKCIRPWESKIRTLTISSKLVDCIGASPMKCMRIKSGLKWKNFYSSIEGFDYTPGYTYRIQVLETKIENPPADGSNLSYELIQVLSKKPTVKTLQDTPLHGEWKLQTYNSEKVSGIYTANFESKRASFKFCNSMSGEYALSGNIFTTSGFMSTEMYCMGWVMTLEDNFELDGAKYSLIATKSIPAQHILTITTKKGSVYVYRK
jgi:heat shock protein HslJ